MLKYKIFLFIFSFFVCTSLINTNNFYTNKLESQEFKVKVEQQKIINYLSEKYGKPIELVQEIVEIAYLHANYTNISPFLILAIIEKESSLTVKAKSSYGAIGLMQVVPRFHKEKLKENEKPEDLQVVSTNIRIGSEVLKEYIELKNGDVHKALAKYSGNAKGYIKNVFKLKEELKFNAKSA